MELRTLDDAERYLDGFVNLERKASFDYKRLGLARVRALLGEIGNPERGLPCVHVAGSNGKGTVSLASEALLIAAGCRTGTFTSPHLESWSERFRISGESVAAADLVATLREIVPAIERLRKDEDLRPSFFDVCTALALAVFRRQRVDVGVIEVGIGGRIDSTNVVESRVCVLTAVQLEHTDKLGDTLEKIAGEKAGIAKPGVTMLHGVLDPEAWGALAARAVAVDAPLEEVRALGVELGPEGVRFELADGRRVKSPVLGRHQAGNLALAIRACEIFLGESLPPAAFKALEELVLPARLERIGSRVLLDSAHTPDAAAALRSTLESVEPDRIRVLVSSISRDKDAAGLLAELAPGTRVCVLCLAEPTRSADPADLAPLAWASGIGIVETIDDPVAAVERAFALAEPDELIVVAGSVFLAGAVRAHLLRRASDR